MSAIGKTIDEASGPARITRSQQMNTVFELLSAIQELGKDWHWSRIDIVTKPVDSSK